MCLESHTEILVKQFGVPAENPSSASFLCSVSKTNLELAHTQTQQAKDKFRPVQDLHYIFLPHLLNNLCTTLSFHKFHPHLLHSTNRSPPSSLPPSPAQRPQPPASCPASRLAPPRSHPVSPVHLLHGNRAIQSGNYPFASCNQPSFRPQEPQCVGITLHPLLLIPPGQSL